VFITRQDAYGIWRSVFLSYVFPSTTETTRLAAPG
jgi:hypothetical protein